MAQITRKRKVLPRLELSAGLLAKYQKRLKTEIEAMQNSVEYFLTGKVEKAIEAGALVADANPVDTAQKTLNEIKRRYLKRFRELSKTLPSWIVQEIYKETDNRFALQIKTNLEDIKSIKFTMTPQMRLKVKAALRNNSEQIKKIPQEFFSRVENAAMSNILNNRGAAPLMEELKKTYGMTESRAYLNANYQLKNIQEQFYIERKKEIGLFRAIWRHSRVSLTPRKTHKEADGREFDIRKGCYIDGKWIFPKQEINCNCYQETIIE
ncbi:MAG: hypothetical protein LBV16_06360 [Elusimicrobiota bacterium]|jgi:uncharacterized protein with gpF-like domain|nr:hypothetical protein [Elusimicrobiota bacterium]